MRAAPFLLALSLLRHLADQSLRAFAQFRQRVALLDIVGCGLR